MRAKTLLTVLFLVSLGVAAFVFVRAMQLRVPQQNVTADAAVLPKKEILVAKVPLAAGTLLRDQDLDWRVVAGSPAVDEIVRPALSMRQMKPELDAQTRASVYGAALALALPTGVPIRHSIIVKPGDRGFLRLVLSPGERAIAIPVATGGASTGLLSPGDRVDVVLTQVFNQTGEPLARKSVGETIAQDLRVLAMGTPNAHTAGNFGPTVTLEVTPVQAEAINVATELGKLSLTLRPTGMNETASVGLPGDQFRVKAAWAGDVSPALGSVTPPGKPVVDPPPIAVIRGGKSEAVKQR